MTTMLLKMVWTLTLSSKEFLILKMKVKKPQMGVKSSYHHQSADVDNLEASTMLSDIREEIISLKLDTINNGNIKNEHLGRRGLHLNQHEDLML